MEDIEGIVFSILDTRLSATARKHFFFLEELRAAVQQTAEAKTETPLFRWTDQLKGVAKVYANVSIFVAISHTN